MYELSVFLSLLPPSFTLLTSLPLILVKKFLRYACSVHLHTFGPQYVKFRLTYTLKQYIRYYYSPYNVIWPPFVMLTCSFMCLSMPLTFILAPSHLEMLGLPTHVHVHLDHSFLPLHVVPLLSALRHSASTLPSHSYSSPYHTFVYVLSVLFFLPPPLFPIIVYLPLHERFYEPCHSIIITNYTYVQWHQSEKFVNYRTKWRGNNSLLCSYIL